MPVMNARLLTMIEFLFRTHASDLHEPSDQYLKIMRTASNSWH